MSEADILERIKKKFESCRDKNKRYFSVSGVELFPNERDRLWLDWLDYVGAKDTSIKTFLEMYPS